MDGLMARIVCILMENNNYFTLIRGADTTCCDNFEVGELMVVNATHIDSAVSGSNDATLSPAIPPFAPRLIKEEDCCMKRRLAETL